MSRTYYELLPYAFKKFSLKKALLTGFPTLMHRVNPRPLEKSSKPALFTMNIFPPMMTVWYHLVQKNVGNKVDTVIFDCSGSLQQSDFPNARVQKYLNLYAATKSDEFLYRIAKNRKVGWICDDDMFILSPKCIDEIESAFSNEHTASLSFRPRDWWHFEIEGEKYEPSGSYCLAINREIYCDKEHLSLAPSDGNKNSVSHIGKEVKRYDTFDKANETLIRKGYNCNILPEEKRKQCVIGFSGMSSAVMLLWHFNHAKQMTDYLQGPEDKAWRGNTLYTVLSGLLAARTIVELHEKITGKMCTVRSLPTRAALESIRKEKEHLLREGHSFDRVDEVSAVIHKAI